MTELSALAPARAAVPRLLDAAVSDNSAELTSADWADRKDSLSLGTVTALLLGTPWAALCPPNVMLSPLRLPPVLLLGCAACPPAPDAGLCVRSTEGGGSWLTGTGPAAAPATGASCPYPPGRCSAGPAARAPGAAPAAGDGPAADAVDRPGGFCCGPATSCVASACCICCSLALSPSRRAVRSSMRLRILSPPSLAATSRSVCWALCSSLLSLSTSRCCCCRAARTWSAAEGPLPRLSTRPIISDSSA
mmetsp:Transcript_29897/g.66147  ORF Transcript_29897/g.66147 Transcript_29897/m.66147 type:complete len:249 (-) Transcript_29897:597-1343(-)